MQKFIQTFVVQRSQRFATQIEIINIKYYLLTL